MAYEVPYVNFEMRPLTNRSMWNETAPIATALPLRGNHQMEVSMTRSRRPHVFVSGIKNFSPRLESRLLSWSDSHGLEANPPTRKANYD